ncbi:MAG: alpha/beta fold hydrolase [Alphaproteobacteria bacterium]|nr:alpha/beta fold hydrolase [Alphaproteobacteria bacterium]
MSQPPPGVVLADPFAAFGAMVHGIDGFDQLERIRRGMWIHASTPRPPVGTTPHEVIHHQDKLKLRYYAPPVKVPGLLPVVLVPSMINRAYILDLEPDRSLVGWLAARGHGVYLVDWGSPGPEDAEEGVAYALEELLRRAVFRARHHARSARVALFGYCMGGTLAAMYAALHPEEIGALIALNAPVRFAEAGRFREFVDSEVVDLEAAIRSDGLMPVEVMVPAFRMLNPMGNWNKYLGIEAAAKDPRRLARVMARERWLEENVPIAGAFAREWIREAYQQDSLLEGTWEIGGQRADLSRVTAPALVVCCSKDFITPPAAARPLAEALGSEDVELVELDMGHIGVVVGGAGPKLFYPLLDTWLRRVAGLPAPEEPPA